MRIIGLEVGEALYLFLFFKKQIHTHTRERERGSNTREALYFKQQKFQIKEKFYFMAP